jgi:hypothetical protein
VGPVTCLEYLGIVLDTVKFEARLPMDKVNRICEFIRNVLGKRSCTKRKLLKLLGHLNFASCVIVPGRSFVLYLVYFSTHVKELHHYLILNKECRVDLQFWLTFLSDWNSINMFYDCSHTSSVDMELYTDASASRGFVGYYTDKWFSSAWSEDLPLVSDKTLFIAFLELYPIYISAILWDKDWKWKNILF